MRGSYRYEIGRQFLQTVVSTEYTPYEELD
jgi:hypothetical protein